MLQGPVQAIVPEGVQRVVACDQAALRTRRSILHGQRVQEMRPLWSNSISNISCLLHFQLDGF